ncbi:dihydrofolate reductase family protein [Demequina sp. NBRC 110051]|uniref:dihydrofolate reductase family protein n=1 Tax=Demequina sp. NBRC 110051 TaxID=1570340 RepID=UPI00117EDEEF|nr:dihydrofolate reductase family protein [Demequina sp. NBRC 110051]
MSRVLVYCAMSVDGFIAGPGDDIAWLEAPRPSWAPTANGPWAEDRATEGVEYDDFFAGIGAMLMGRRTFDVVHGMGEWFYGDTPVIVATGRPLPPDPGVPASVTTASAPIANLVAEALEAAGERNVYLDGGSLIRQALDADLIDEMVVTIHPTILGAGHPLFAGAEQRHMVTVNEVRRFGEGLVQLVMHPARRPVDHSPVPAYGGPAGADAADAGALGHA